MSTSFARPWQMLFNTAMDSGSSANAAKNAAWQMKAIMKGDVTLKDNTSSNIGSPSGLWTHYSSSDASTYGVDSTDRWLTAYDVTKLTAATSGAHSHITLKSINSYGGATGNLYFTIDMSASLNTINYYLSRTAPTGGSTSLAPRSSADEMTFSHAHVAAGVSAAKAHGCLSTSGDLIYFVSQNASGFAAGQTFLGSLLDAKSQDGFPHLWMSGLGGSATATPFARVINSVSQPSTLQMRDRGNITTVNPSLPFWAIGNTSTSMFAQMTTTDTTDSNYDDMPAYVFVNRAGFYSLRGRLPDMYQAPESAGQATVEPASGQVLSTVVSNLWIPAYVAPSF